MASLYTPAPQRQGLDWLAGMTRDAQQLWQNQAQIEQAKKRLQIAAQQQEMQREHFWKEQERLAGQQEFQNRKFLYEIGKDKRDSTRQGALDQWRMQNEAADNRLAERKFQWDVNPTTPENRYRVAATANLGANAEQTRAETGYLYGDTGELTPQVDSARGIDSMFSTDANGDPAGDGGITGANLFPDITGTEKRQGALYETRNAKPEIIEAGGTKWAKLPNARGGYYYQSVKAAPGDDLDKEINTYQDNLAALRGRLRDYPTFPSGETPNPEAVKEYQERKAKIDSDNAPVRREMVQAAKQLDSVQTKKRLAETPFKLNNITPTFEKELLSTVVKAVEEKNVEALQKIRPRVEVMAQAGDASALETLQFLNSVLPQPETVAKPRSTGYFE